MLASSRSRRWSSRETRAGFGERKRRPHRHRRGTRTRRAVPRRRRGGRAQARATDLSRAPRGGARADAGRAQSARGGGSAGGGQTGAGPEGQVAEEHGLPGAAAPGRGQREARGRAAHHAQRGAAPRREAIDRHGRRHGEHGRGGVSLPPVLAEHRGAGAASVAAPVPKHSSRGGGLVPGTSRRVGERSHAPQAVGELCVRPRSTGSDRAGRTNQGVPGAARRLDCGRALRALLFQRQAAVRRLLLGLAVLSAGPTVRPSDAQDTSAIDRGVRIGIVYRPGVRPGMVVLPVHAPALDSARIILSRDLDYSDRFELITLPGGDSIRVTAAAPGARPPAAGGAGRTGGGGAAAAATLNYPLYQALGADFAVAVAAGSGDSAIVTVHDVAAGGVRRELRARLPALKDPGVRLAIHQDRKSTRLNSSHLVISYAVFCL